MWRRPLAVALAPEDVNTSEAPNDELAKAIVIDRCAPCHSGINAPLGVRLTNTEQMQEHANKIVGLVKSGDAAREYDCDDPGRAGATRRPGGRHR